MTVALRKLEDGSPVEIGEAFYAPGQGWKYFVESWNTAKGRALVFGRPFGGGRLRAFAPSEVGLYIGHERGQPISAIKWGGPPDPSIKAAWIADAYRKAMERARECPDPLLARALSNGVQDFMLQIMKLVGAGAPAMDELLSALASERPGLNPTTEELEA